MAGKNIALSGAVVKLLDDAKRKGESYSDVVLRLARGPRPMGETLEFLKSLEPVEDDSLDKIVHEIRQASRNAKPRRARF
jgi:predicted CopG family antitoxin